VRHLAPGPVPPAVAQVHLPVLFLVLFLLYLPSAGPRCFPGVVLGAPSAFSQCCPERQPECSSQYYFSQCWVPERSLSSTPAHRLVHLPVCSLSLLRAVELIAHGCTELVAE
jgi:hypothetical protein